MPKTLKMRPSLSFAAALAALAAFSLPASAQTPPTCPAHVRFDAKMGKLADFPFDGPMAFFDTDGSLAFARLKSQDKMVKVPSIKKVGKTSFSPDGKWLMAVIDRKIWMIKTDGTVTKNLELTCLNMATFYYSSPLEEAKKGIFEIAFIDTSATEMWAQKLDLSGAQPLVLEKRKIGTGITKKADGSEIAAAGQHFVWDSRSINTAGSVVFTIPNGGRGTAAGTDYQPAAAKYHCASSLSLNGSMFLTNVSWVKGGYNAGMQCLPTANVQSHTGFILVSTRKPLPAAPSFTDWALKPAEGALAVLWTPETIDGVKTRLLNGESLNGAPNFNWYAGFTNHDDYIVAGLAEPASVKNDFLVNWKTNTWIPIYPKGGTRPGAGLWLEGVPQPTTALKPQAAQERDAAMAGRLRAGIAQKGPGFDASGRFRGEDGAAVWSGW